MVEGLTIGFLTMSWALATLVRIYTLTASPLHHGCPPRFPAAQLRGDIRHRCRLPRSKNCGELLGQAWASAPRRIGLQGSPVLACCVRVLACGFPRCLPSASKDSGSTFVAGCWLANKGKTLTPECRSDDCLSHHNLFNGPFFA